MLHRGKLITSLGQCVMRKVIKGILERKIFALKLLLLSNFSKFFKNIPIQLFNLSANFQILLLLLFSCCPAELESVQIFKYLYRFFSYAKNKFNLNFNIKLGKEVHQKFLIEHVLQRPCGF